MDPKLKKLFERTRPIEDTRRSRTQLLVDELIAAVLRRESLVITNLTPHERGDLFFSLLTEALREKTVWYATPSRHLTPFRLYLMKSTLGDDNLSVMSKSQMDRARRRIVVWSLDVLSSQLLTLDDLAQPDFVVIDDAEYVGHTEFGSMLEEVLLCLPLSTPVALLLPSVSNSAELARWVEKSRQTPCRIVDLGQRPGPAIAAFISSTWDLVPLLDNKGLRGKVRRFVKETSPFPNVHAEAFVRGLVSLLRAEELAPAVVLMPTGQECDLAAGACQPVYKEIGDALTEPQVAATLDRHPDLKEHPLLARSLTRRAAPLHAGHHPLWAEWVERLVQLGYLDIVFATADAAETLTTDYRSAVFCTSNFHDGRRLRPLSSIQMQRITGRLDGSANAGAACVALAHTADIDVVGLKDLLLTSTLHISSAFRCSFPGALSLFARAAEPAPLLERSLSALQASNEGTHGRLAELATELLGLLPQAQCFANIETVASLIDLRYRLSMRRDQLAGHRGKTATGGEKTLMDRERDDLARTIGLFPCENCEHLAFCHRRAYRKFRELLDEYMDLRKTTMHGVAGLKIDLQRHAQCLMDSGLLGPDQHLTQMGAVAHRTGLHTPQPLLEALRRGALVPSRDVSALALIGGFVESPELDSFLPAAGLTAEIEDLTSPYEALQPVVQAVVEQMLRFGMLAAGPSIDQSAILLALERGRKTSSLAEQTGIPAGALIRLEQDARYLLQQLRNCLPPESW